MAERITGHLYRVGLDSEYNYIYISADSLEDLIRYLVDHYTDDHSIVGVKEIQKDSILRSVQVTDNPLFLQLTKEKLESEPFIPTKIDGSFWAVMLPTGDAESGDRFNMWDRVSKVTAQRNDLLHYHTILSLCKEQPSDTDCCIGRGCMSVHYENHIPKNIRREHLGFRPMLIPLDSKTLLPDNQRLNRFRDGTRLTLGTLYMNGTPLLNPQKPQLNGDIPIFLPGAQLHFGDTSKEETLQIQWIKIGNVLICDRNLLRYLSWNDLDHQGFVHGKRKSQPSRSSQLPFADQIKHANREASTQGRGEAIPSAHSETTHSL